MIWRISPTLEKIHSKINSMFCRVSCLLWAVLYDSGTACLHTAVQPYGRSERMLCSASSSAATLLHCFAASRLHISAAVFTTVCWTAAAGAAGAKSCIGTPSPPASAYLRPPPPPPTPLWRLLSPLTRRLLNPPAGLCLGNCIVDGLKRSYFLFSEHLFAVVQRQR